MLRLPTLQLNLLKSNQLLLRPRQPRLLIPDINLHRLPPLHVSHVADGDDQLDGRAVGRQDAPAEGRPAVLEGGVGEAVAEGEERGDARAVVVPVADVQAFAVDHFEVLAGPVVVGWGVLEAAGEGALEKGWVS